jgi:uncharacterized protein YqeY
MSLIKRIIEDMKHAMKAKETVRLGAIRLTLAAIKQREIDERIELDDAAVVADLADAEKFEVDVLMAYMPQAMSTAEIEAIVVKAVAAAGAKAVADMGKVMALVKPQIAGRADMGEVSKLVKSKLA